MIGTMRRMPMQHTNSIRELYELIGLLTRKGYFEEVLFLFFPQKKKDFGFIIAMRK